VIVKLLLFAARVKRKMAIWIPTIGVMQNGRGNKMAFFPVENLLSSRDRLERWKARIGECRSVVQAQTEELKARQTIR
jgi:hypothetical protein